MVFFRAPFPANAGIAQQTVRAAEDQFSLHSMRVGRIGTYLGHGLTITRTEETCINLYQSAAELHTLLLVVNKITRPSV
jgi:hypothetical protein